MIAVVICGHRILEADVKISNLRGFGFFMCSGWEQSQLVPHSNKLARPTLPMTKLLCLRCRILLIFVVS